MPKMKLTVFCLNCRKRSTFNVPSDVLAISSSLNRIYLMSGMGAFVNIQGKVKPEAVHLRCKHCKNMMLQKECQHVKR